MTRHDRTGGFTIVELLIVIVVIAILAAVTIVSYNGVTAQARVAVAKSDLENLATAISIYRLDNNRLPQSAVNTSTPIPEVAEIFKTANLYSSTRRTDVNDNSHTKSFLYCSNDTSTKVAFVAFKPVRVEELPAIGTKFMYASDSGLSANEATVTAIVNGSIGYTYCAAIDSSLTRARWSYSIPTAYAQ